MRRSCEVLLLIGLLVGCNVDNATTDTVEELYPIWSDDYETVVGEWPRDQYGFTDEQVRVLRNATRVIVGRLDPYEGQEKVNTSFHLHEVRQAIVIGGNEGQKIATSLLEAACDGCGTCGEFFPELGVRIWSGEEVVDFLIVPGCGMYIYTPTGIRFTETDGDLLRELRDLMESDLSESEA